MKDTITCPVRGCLAQLRYYENAETSQILGVAECSLLGDQLDCDEECIKLINIRRGATASESSNPDNP